MKKRGRDKNSENYTPLRVLFILLLVSALLRIFMFCIPTGESTIFGKYTLVFPTIYDVFHQDTSVDVSIESVLADVHLDDNQAIDTIKDVISVTHLDSSKRMCYSSVDTIHPLHLFFKTLKNIQKQDNTIHILHFGDSQLEGDRISSYLRKKMQQRFGGSGVGIVLPIDISNARRTILQNESKDWRKWAIYGNKNKLNNRLYGIGGSSYSYTGSYRVVIGSDTTISRRKIARDTVSSDTSSPAINIPKNDSISIIYDTLINPIYETKNMESSWITFKSNYRADSLNQVFSNVSFLYHSKDTSKLSYSVNGKYSQKTLYPSRISKKIILSNSSRINNLRLNFSGPSPFIDAFLLDGDKGIAVDNFPMRGSSGLGFETINSFHFNTMLQQVNAKLIIMQYGINVVPHPRKNYDYYYRMFKAQLVAIKKAQPEISILVIGPSDMSRKHKGKYVSYPNLDLISNAMERAAFETNCGFWNLYKAMGGKNSMVSWVNNKPSLAGKDYTHFNPRGAEFVGQMIYNALMYDYENWLNLNQ